ncbi:hypothetical protein D3C80_1466690 [compost metagenome]
MLLGRAKALLASRLRTRLITNGLFMIGSSRWGSMATGGNTRDLAVNKKLNDLIVTIDPGDYGVGPAPAMFSPTLAYGWPQVARLPGLLAAPIHRVQTGMISDVE